MVREDVEDAMTMAWCRLPIATFAMSATIACSGSSAPTGPTPAPAAVWPVRVTLAENES